MKSSVSKIRSAVSALGTPSLNSSVPIRVSTRSGADSDWTVSAGTSAQAGAQAGASAATSANALIRVGRIIVSSSREPICCPTGLALARSTLDLLPISRQPRRRAQDAPPAPAITGTPRMAEFDPSVCALRATARRAIEELTADPDRPGGASAARRGGAAGHRRAGRRASSPARGCRAGSRRCPTPTSASRSALDFIARCDAPAIELGFLAARRASLATFSQRGARRDRWPRRPASRGSRRSPGWPAARTARSDVHVRREGADVRIVADLVGFRDDPSVGFVEWLNLQALVSVVRSAGRP